MIKDYKNDLFYVCSMFEFIARKTRNKIKDIVNYMSDSDIEHELKAASVNHCLSFDQVSDEWIEKYKIKKGDFDNITTCKYKVPTYLSIGKVYQRLILDVMEDKKMVECIRLVFNSFICEEISNFNSNVYYSNPDYLKCSFEAGTLLS